MTNSILITGVCGMVGSHLTEFLLDNTPATNIIGSYYKPTTDITEISPKVKLIECDVRYFHSVLNIISEFMPAKIFHLAAQSYPSVSWGRPQETLDTNVTGTINIFEAVKQARKINPTYDPVIVVACSSAEYGQSMIDSDGFVTEDAPLLPLSPYGVSKVAQDLLSYQYFRSDRIRTIRARIFNTTGPKKVGDVLADFTKRAVSLKSEQQKLFRVGNIETERAITDVRDLIRALYLLSEKGQAGECYNICGSTKYKISELITILESVIGFKLTPVVDKSLLRPTDEKIIFGDTAKLFTATGWTQTIPIEATVRDMVSYWEKSW